MADERVQRRLAAILAADVVGYSRLMGEDEAGTVARLKCHNPLPPLAEASKAEAETARAIVRRRRSLGSRGERRRESTPEAPARAGDQ